MVCEAQEEMFRDALRTYYQNAEWFHYAKRLEPFEKKSGEMRVSRGAMQDAEVSLQEAIVDLVRCRIEKGG